MEPMTLTEAYDYFVETGKPISNDDVFDGAAMIFDESKNLLTRFTLVVVPTNPDFDDLTTWLPWEPLREYVSYEQAMISILLEGKSYKFKGDESNTYFEKNGSVFERSANGNDFKTYPTNQMIDGQWYLSDLPPTDPENGSTDENHAEPVFDLTYEEAKDLADMGGKLQWKGMAEDWYWTRKKGEWVDAEDRLIIGNRYQLKVDPTDELWREI